VQDQLNRHRSIAKHIIDGTVTIDSVSEFRGMLQVFPENPALHAAFADLLIQKKSHRAAAIVYGKSAELYVKNHRIVSALLAKIMQWRITHPSHEQARKFYTLIQSTNTIASNVKNFFRSLSYAEFIALTNRVVRVQLPARTMIKKIGDIEKTMYIVASGALCDTVYRPLKRGEKTQKKITFYLSENDVLGDILPFGKEIISQSYTQTISGVELMKISKSRLAEVCGKYPGIERALVRLIENCRNKSETAPARGNRKAGRQPLPIEINLEVYPNGDDDTPLMLQGFSRDISVGGVCVVVDAKYANISRYLMALSNADILVCIPGDVMTLNVSGSVVWSREVTFEDQKTVALGIRFKDMTPKLSGMLVVFADMLNSD
jgi:CRP-like cAMP-binding protein